MANEITSLEFSREDEYEKSLRPKKLSEFVGQNQFIGNLKIYIEAARQREEALDHLLLSGPPGLGKTTLASIIAYEMNVNFKSTSAPVLEKPGDLAAILTDIGPNDLFFIDEIHRLKPNIEEILYSAMEDFEMDIIIGQGPSAKSIKISLNPFTLVGATTRAGLISAPLRARFGIHENFEFYNLDEMATIIRRSSGILGCSTEDPALKTIAKASRGTPRVANRLLRRIRDFAQVEGKGVISQPVALNALKRLEVDPEGLNKIDNRLLKIMIESYDGGPVGAKTLAVSLGEEPETIEEVYEPFLIQKGLIQRTPRGRVATRKAYLHLGLPFKDRTGQGLFDADESGVD